MTYPLAATHLFDFADVTAGRHLINVTAGHSEDVLLLMLEQPRELTMDSLSLTANHHLQEKYAQFLNALVNTESERMHLLLATNPTLIQAWDENERDLLLHVCVLWEEQNAVALLLEHGADINAAGEGGRTALHNAARWHLLKMIELLLRRGADLEARDDSGRTPLQLSNQVASRSHSAIRATRLLLEHGADANVVDGNGNRPLHLVQNSVRSAICLLAFGANPNGRNRFGRTPLHEAAQWSATLVSLLTLDVK